MTSGKLIRTTKSLRVEVYSRRPRRPQIFERFQPHVSPGKFRQLCTVKAIILYAWPSFLSSLSLSLFSLPSDKVPLKADVPLAKVFTVAVSTLVYEIKEAGDHTQAYNLE